MQVTPDLVKHVASIARIELTDEEINKFTPQLAEVLELFSQLEQVDTQDIEPSFQPVRVENKLREDKIQECLPQKQVLALSKHKADGYFKGPRAV